MKAAFLVNDSKDIQPTQTTAMLIESATRLLDQVYVMGIRDWILEDNHLMAVARKAAHIPDSSLEKLLHAIRSEHGVQIQIEDMDLLLMRTNPARDKANGGLHEASLQFARMAGARGVSVINNPEGLIKLGNKLDMSYIPDRFRPRTFIANSKSMLENCIKSLKEKIILKPLEGTRGQDVTLFDKKREAEIIRAFDDLSQNDYVIVQECIPEGKDGDTRIVVLAGKMLEIDGQAAAIRRIPAEGDFRSNLHAGGRAAPAVITRDMREIVEAMGPELTGAGIHLAGIDVIGGKVIEVNVYSTGGLKYAEQFTGKRFSDLIIKHFIKLAEP